MTKSLNPQRYNYKVHLPLIAIVSGMGLVFALDVLTPSGTAISVLYSLGVAASIRLPGQHVTMGLAALGTVLVLLGLEIPPAGSLLWNGLYNGMLAIVLLWVTAAIVQERKRSQQALLAANNELEQRVVERTTHLSRLNTQLEDQVRHSDEVKASLREIIDLVPHRIFVKDREGRFLLVNKVVAQAYGKEPRDLIGKRQRDLHNESAEVERLHRDDLQVIDSGQPKLQYEETITNAQGDVRSLITSKIPFHMPGNPEDLILGVAIDVTEKKQVEAITRTQEELLLQLANNIEEVFYIRELASNRMIYISPAYEKIWGSPLETIYRDPKAFMNAVHPEDKPRVIAAMEAQKDGRYFNEEYRIVRGDGSERWIRARSFPIRDDAGEIYRMTGVAEDVTARKNAEFALLQSEARFRVVLENASDAIVFASVDGKLTEVNRRAEALLGYGRDELIGMDARKIHPPQEWEALQSALNDIRQKGSSLHEHLVVKRDGSTVPDEVAGTLITMGKEQFALGVFRDLTERKRHEQERLQQEREYRDTLVREVHHRIKNHLQGVLGLMHQQITRQTQLREPMIPIISQVQTVALVHGLHGADINASIQLCDMVAAICDSNRSLTNSDVVAVNRLVRPMKLNSDETVPVALVINELVLNAVKHCGCQSKDCEVTVELMDGDGMARVKVINPGVLPPGFDFTNSQKLGTGLRLVRTLLSGQHAQLSFKQEESGNVVAELQLRKPLILSEQEMEN
jgi:PAS domain S-box-containing protein